MNRRTLEETVFKALMLLSVAVVVGSLIIIIGVVVVNGASSLTLEMFTKTSEGGYFLGREGGILNAILGSLLLALPATLIAFAVSFGIAVALQREFLHGVLAGFVRFSLDILWGIPSIIYGVFGFIVMIGLGIGTSVLAGIVALTLLEIPIITRYMDESLSMVPFGLKETAYSLGSTRMETSLRVVRRQALPGILAGILLGLGRGIGDAASILFTAGFSDRIPGSLFDATAALPTMIFNLYASPVPLVRQRAYAAAFILLVIILLISILSRWLTKRSMKFIIR